jgi:hypothetical protein
MLNMEALDKVIAVVMVILVLSLFVQSLQALLKKLFKIKSLQIETSLVHLFNYVVNGNVLNVIESKLNNAPFLRMIIPRTKHPSEKIGGTVETLYCAVENEFRKVGRVTTSGKMMLDSISKDDLLKFVGKIENSELVKEFAPKLADEVTLLKDKIKAVETSWQAIKTDAAPVLSAAKIEFDKVEQAVVPVIADINRILAGQPDATKLALADIGKLGALGPESVSAVQAQVNDAIASLSKLEGGNAAATQAAITALRGLNDALNGLATIAPGIAKIKSLLGKVETWYDTVMQSFEERYTRGMRTWAWVISALVVIFLNANLVNIYRQISTGDAQRAVILKAAEQYHSTAKPSEGTPSNPGGGNQPNAGGGNQANTESLTPEQWYDEAKKVIEKNTDAYTSLGFEGPAWIKRTWQWLWSGPSGGTWKAGIILAIKTLFGWFVMTLLLSAGAPFWEDVLESLFGVKNLVRSKSGTKNVEQQSGEGQPKP